MTSVMDIQQGAIILNYLNLGVAKLELRKHFSERVINDWNGLPNEVFNVLSIEKFKELLDGFWL